MKRTILTGMLLMLYCMVATATTAEEITIKSGTPVPVRLLTSVSSETSAGGQMLQFEVTRDVMVNNKLAIKAGSEVVGEVTHAQKTGSLGKEGRLGIMVRYATAVDGTRVPLRAMIDQTGNESVALSWMVCPFIKGDAVHVNAGTETKAYVDYDTKINAN